MAYGAFGTPPGARSNGPRTNTAREAAMRECTLISRRYTQTTWGTMELHQQRACMAEHGQME